MRALGKRSKDLNQLLGKEFLRIGSALLRKRRHIGSDSEQVLETKEAKEEEEEVAPPRPVGSTRDRLKALIKREERIVTLVWSLLGCILWYGWAGFILLNVNIPCGYNSMRLPPSPGPYYCSRYGFQWGLFYFMWYNWVPCILLVLGVVLVKSRTILSIHFLVNVVIIFGNLVCFFCLLGIMWGWCNNFASFGSPCNAPVNCCVNGASSFALGWCNTPGVCTPQVSFSQLSASDPFYLSWLWTVFFILYSFFSFGLNTLLL